MELLKCPFCGKDIENDSFFCDQCGEELKICPSGHHFKKGKICNECGTKLVEAKNASESNPEFNATAPDKTVRTAPPSSEPKYLVCSVLNAHLDLKDSAIIGRAGDYAHIFGSQGYISRTHARIQKNAAGAWEIVDLNSSNGTFLNGKQLAPNQPAVFKTGDTIAFYDLKFVVQSE